MRFERQVLIVEIWVCLFYSSDISSDPTTLDEAQTAPLIPLIPPSFTFKSGFFSRPTAHIIHCKELNVSSCE